MSKSLTERTINGAGWSFVDNIANQGITFLVGVVLARLLSPDEYGLIGIITIFIILFSAIVDSGLSTALIRDKEVDDNDYNTAFWANSGLGIVMFLILFLMSNIIARFFERVELVSLTRAMAFVLVINSISTVQRTILTKKLDFKIQTKVSLIASLGSGIVGIGMAFLGWGVWSLVGQQISRQALQSLFLWIWSSWSPQLFFSYTSFKKMYVFGWKIMVSSIINSIWNEAYQIVIGKFYTPSCLGQYTRAKQFADIFSVNLTSVVQRVSFPALSEIQDEQERLKESYRRALKITMLFTFFFLFVLAAMSKALIISLIGNQWDDAIRFLPIICLQCIFYPLSAINLNILMVKGKSGVYLKLEVVKRIIAIIPLLLGIFIGIYYMLWGSVIYGIIAYCINAYYSGKEINYTLKEQVKDLAPTFIYSFFVSCVVFVVGYVDSSCYIVLLLQMITAIILSIFVLSITNNREFLFAKEMVTTFIVKYLKVTR